MRAAIVGTGAIGRVHARLIADLGGELVGVCGRTGQAAAAFSKAPAYDDFNLMLNEQKPDVVHVCTPNRFHAEQTIAAFRAGAHVLCEKPMAVSTQEAARMIEAAEATGRIGAVAYCYRGYPIVRELRTRVREGAFGEIWRVAGAYLSQDVFETSAYQWHFTPGLCGPSYALMDIGIHWFDLVQYILGEPVETLSARFNTRRPKRTWLGGPGQGPRPDGIPGSDGGIDVGVGLEEQADILFSLRGGASGTCSVSVVSPGNANHIAISVDGSSAGFDWQQEEAATYVERGSGHKILRYRDKSRLDPAEQAVILTGPGNPDGYLEAFRTVVAESWAAMQGEAGQEYPSFGAGLIGLELVEAAISSASSHAERSIEVSPERFRRAYQL
ncbi:MAG: Gfo/Idh/MocA family oxidoreductase [Hyphomicrobiaceae bacterium]|nr:Gfo/Idh/MocA family oxidoreductase [Hyphomicrobiaceae bacterium]